MSPLLDFLIANDEAFRSSARIASLYSDFRSQKSTNPDGYAANCAAWLRALSAAAQAGLIPSTGTERDRFVIHLGEELVQALQHPKYGRPLALGSVIEEAVPSNQFVALQKFLNMHESIYARSWLPTPSKLLSWGLHQVGLVGANTTDGRLTASDLVMIETLETAADDMVHEVNQRSTSANSRLYAKQRFVDEIASGLGYDQLSDNDFAVLAVYISRDKSSASYDKQHQVLKFKSHGNSTDTHISQEDLDIAELTSVIHAIDIQVTRLEEQVAEFDSKTRAAIVSKNMNAAKKHLRYKKLAEKTLQQRSSTLQQLQDVYTQIEQAANQAEIVQVMESSGRALQAINARTGSVEKIDEIMESLREEMETTEDIGRALNTVGDTIDEAEVEDEFEELQAAEKARVQLENLQQRDEDVEAEAEKARKLLEKLDPPSAAVESRIEASKTKSQDTDKQVEDIEQLIERA